LSARDGGSVFNYYLTMAALSLKRNLAVTSLIVTAIGIGIGASMTTLTMFRAMSADPIPQKSAQLFAVQIDNWGPSGKTLDTGDSEHLQKQISYTDAVGLMKARAARRQSAMYATTLAVTPANSQLEPFQVPARAVYADFFTMFDVPFLYGGPWGAQDDAGGAAIAIITQELSDRVFGAAINTVGKLINLRGQNYTIVGVMNKWNPVPKFFDLNREKYGPPEQVFLPFTWAIDKGMESSGSRNCAGPLGRGWSSLLRSECIWIQFWAELPTSREAVQYRDFLHRYAAEQRAVGRFNWPPHTRLRDVRAWLVYSGAVTTEARLLVLISFGFLLVCLLNAMGLILAKILGRTAEISVRRALGAARREICTQFVIEAGFIGFIGGLLGLVLTAIGLFGLREVLSADAGRLTQLDPVDMGLTLLIAIAASVGAALYPIWRAAQIQPAWQLKAG
jgi:putative ABC transport system permease protein